MSSLHQIPSCLAKREIGLWGIYLEQIDRVMQHLGSLARFEWAQDFSSFFWTVNGINLRLTRIMREAFAAVPRLAEEKKVSLRTAAFIGGCTRVVRAREMPGLYP